MPMFSRLARLEVDAASEETPLLVYGVPVTLWDDPDTAESVNSGSTLLPWHGDESLLVDRFDARSLLDDLKAVQRKKGKKPPESCATTLDPEDAIYDEERYRDLPHEVEEDAQPDGVAGAQDQPGDEARQPATADTPGGHAGATGGFHHVGFSYASGGAVSATVAGGEVREEEAREGRVLRHFVPPFPLPPHLAGCLPSSEKQHRIIAHAARFVAGKGGQMEIVLRVKQRDNATLGFLQPGHPLHPYYRHLRDHPELADIPTQGGGDAAGSEPRACALSMVAAYEDEEEEGEEEGEEGEGEGEEEERAGAGGGALGGDREVGGEAGALGGAGVDEGEDAALLQQIDDITREPGQGDDVTKDAVLEEPGERSVPEHVAAHSPGRATSGGAGGEKIVARELSYDGQGEEEGAPNDHGGTAGAEPWPREASPAAAAAFNAAGPEDTRPPHAGTPSASSAAAAATRVVGGPETGTQRTLPALGVEDGPARHPAATTTAAAAAAEGWTDGVAVEAQALVSRAFMGLDDAAYAAAVYAPGGSHPYTDAAAAAGYPSWVPGTAAMPAVAASYCYHPDDELKPPGMSDDEEEGVPPPAHPGATLVEDEDLAPPGLEDRQQVPATTPYTGAATAGALAPVYNPTTGTYVIPGYAAAYGGGVAHAEYGTPGVAAPAPPLDPLTRAIVDKTVAYIAKNGARFQAIIAAKERTNPRFAFLLPWNEHHTYFTAALASAMGGPGDGQAQDGSTAVVVTAEASAALVQPVVQAYEADPMTAGHSAVDAMVDDATAVAAEGEMAVVPPAAVGDELPFADAPLDFEWKPPVGVAEEPDWYTSRQAQERTQEAGAGGVDTDASKGKAGSQGGTGADAGAPPVVRGGGRRGRPEEIVVFAQEVGPEEERWQRMLRQAAAREEREARVAAARAAAEEKARLQREAEEKEREEREAARERELEAGLAERGRGRAVGGVQGDGGRGQGRSRGHARSPSPSPGGGRASGRQGSRSRSPGPRKARPGSSERELRAARGQGGDASSSDSDSEGGPEHGQDVVSDKALAAALDGRKLKPHEKAEVTEWILKCERKRRAAAAAAAVAAAAGVGAGASSGSGAKPGMPPVVRAPPRGPPGAGAGPLREDVAGGARMGAGAPREMGGAGGERHGFADASRDRAEGCRQGVAAGVVRMSKPPLVDGPERPASRGHAVGFAPSGLQRGRDYGDSLPPRDVSATYDEGGGPRGGDGAYGGSHASTRGRRSRSPEASGGPWEGRGGTPGTSAPMARRRAEEAEAEDGELLEEGEAAPPTHAGDRPGGDGAPGVSLAMLPGAATSLPPLSHRRPHLRRKRADMEEEEEEEEEELEEGEVVEEDDPRMRRQHMQAQPDGMARGGSPFSLPGEGSREVRNEEEEEEEVARRIRAAHEAALRSSRAPPPPPPALRAPLPSMGSMSGYGDCSDGRSSKRGRREAEEAGGGGRGPSSRGAGGSGRFDEQRSRPPSGSGRERGRGPPPPPVEIPDDLRAKVRAMLMQVK
eukprot:jgi/Mesvir1/7428/Mv19210-RA.1